MLGSLVPERKREREEKRRSHQSSLLPNTRVNLLLSPFFPPPRSILFIFSAEYRETDSNYQRSKKKEKKRRKERKEKKRKEMKREREGWKAFGKFFHDLDRFFLIVCRSLSRVKRLENCIIGWKEGV